MTAHVCDDTAYPAAAMPDECTCGGMMTEWTPTPELNGRAILLPEARDFTDVLDYVAEWDHATMSHYAGNPPPIGPVELGARYIGENEIGPFSTIEQPNGRRAVAVRATDAAIAAVAPRLVTPDDHLSFKVIEHRDTGRALVVLQHGYILGDHWLAYIDAASIPTPNGEPRRDAIERHRRNVHTLPVEWCPVCKRAAELMPLR